MLVARTDSGRLSKVCLHVGGLGRRAVVDKRERDHVNSPTAEQVGRDGVRGGETRHRRSDESTNSVAGRTTTTGP